MLTDGTVVEQRQSRTSLRNLSSETTAKNCLRCCSDAWRRYCDRLRRLNKFLRAWCDVTSLIPLSKWLLVTFAAKNCKQFERLLTYRLLRYKSIQSVKHVMFVNGCVSGVGQQLPEDQSWKYVPSFNSSRATDGSTSILLTSARFSRSMCCHGRALPSCRPMYALLDYAHYRPTAYTPTRLDVKYCTANCRLVHAALEISVLTEWPEAFAVCLSWAQLSKLFSSCI